MGVPGRQLPEFNQLAAHDDLTLHLLQFGKHALELGVLLHQPVGKPPHQVQLQGFDGTLPQLLESLGKSVDLVVALHLDRVVQVARAHAAYPDFHGDGAYPYRHEPVCQEEQEDKAADGQDAEPGSAR